MKTFRLLAVLVILVGVLGSIPNTASAQKLGSYVTGIQVQNMSSLEANVTIQYVDANGATVLPVGDKIPANGSKNYYPLPVQPGFIGSVVINSDQPVGAITNIQTSDGNARASYNGTSQGSTTVYLPTLMTKNGLNDTYIVIQNAGSADANDVRIDYSDCTTGEPSNLSIKKNASIRINNATETCHTSKIYSAVVTSTQPLVAVVSQEKPGVIYAYTGFNTAGSTNPVMPTAIFNNAGNQVGIQIQNTGDQSTNVTVTYTPSAAGGAGTACTETNTIPAKGSVTFGWPAWQATAPAGYTGTSTCVRNQRFIGSAQVTGNSASQNLQVVVNQAKYGTNRAGSYSAFNPASATPKVVMPYIYDRRGSSALLISAFNLFNVGNSTAYVKCTFTGSSYTFTAELAPGTGTTDNQFNKLGANYLGSAACVTYTNNTYSTVNTNGRILGVANLVTSQPANMFDTLMIYEAINAAP